MRWLERLWNRFVSWFRAAFPEPRRRELPAPYAVLHVEEEPDELDPRTLYAVGENGYLWHVTMVCPCGCRETIALNALPDDVPCWTLHESPEGPTLKPSVWRTAGCRSHFLLQRGQIVWCGTARVESRT